MVNSLIFHRYQEKRKTLIKGKDMCEKVIGYDANSLYLNCAGKEMPTSWYEHREKSRLFSKLPGESCIKNSIQKSISYGVICSIEDIIKAIRYEETFGLVELFQSSASSHPCSRTSKFLSARSGNTCKSFARILVEQLG